MRKFELKKLVRDGIVESMEAKGQQVVHRQLEGAERLLQRGRKIVEEAAEFDPEKPDVNELIDLSEAIDAEVVAMGISPVDFQALKAKRRAERGGFDADTFVETVALADDDPWADYYAAEPARFKELD